MHMCIFKFWFHYCWIQHQ